MYGIQNNPMLQIEIQKAYSKESKFQDKQSISKKICWRNKTSRSKGFPEEFILHLWDWNNIITHTKRHNGWNNPNQFIKVKGAIKEDSDDKCHENKASKEC